MKTEVENRGERYGYIAQIDTSHIEYYGFTFLKNVLVDNIS